MGPDCQLLCVCVFVLVSIIRGPVSLFNDQNPRQQIICCYLHRLNMHNWLRKRMPMTNPLAIRIALYTYTHTESERDETMKEKPRGKKHNRNESMFARAQKVKQLIVGFKTVYILILPESIVGTHRAFILFGVALFRVSSPIRFNCLFAYKYRKLRLESHMHTVLL